MFHITKIEKDIFSPEPGVILFVELFVPSQLSKIEEHHDGPGRRPSASRRRRSLSLSHCAAFTYSKVSLATSV